MGNGQKPTWSRIVTETNFFKILPSLSLHRYHNQQLQNIAMEKDRNYVSLIIIIVSNITGLVSHNVIFVGYFMPMHYSVNKKAPPILFPIPFPQLGFHKACCCLTRNYQPIFVAVIAVVVLVAVVALIKLLWKIIHFQSKTIYFFQLASRFRFCCIVYMYSLGCVFTIHPSLKCKTIISCLHSFLFDHSSDHVT